MGGFLGVPRDPLVPPGPPPTSGAANKLSVGKIHVIEEPVKRAVPTLLPSTLNRVTAKMVHPPNVILCSLCFLFSVFKLFGSLSLLGKAFTHFIQIYLFNFSV